MGGDAGYVDKAQALNSTESRPLVTVTRNAPEHSGEFQLKVAFLLTVRIVAVRAGDNLVMPIPSFKNWQ